MKKLKWIVVYMLVLLVVSNIKANNCGVAQKEKAGVGAKTVQSAAPATLIEQILFPHGM